VQKHAAFVAVGQTQRVDRTNALAQIRNRVHREDRDDDSPAPLSSARAGLVVEHDTDRHSDIASVSDEFGQTAPLVVGRHAAITARTAAPSPRG
jgi:hypothetical protein